jgi:hypothetical protein
MRDRIRHRRRLQRPGRTRLLREVLRRLHLRLRCLVHLRDRDRLRLGVRLRKGSRCLGLIWIVGWHHVRVRS